MVSAVGQVAKGGDGGFAAHFVAQLEDAEFAAADLRNRMRDGDGGGLIAGGAASAVSGCGFGLRGG